MNYILQYIAQNLIQLKYTIDSTDIRRYTCLTGEIIIIDSRVLKQAQTDHPMDKIILEVSTTDSMYMDGQIIPYIRSSYMDADRYSHSTFAYSTEVGEILVPLLEGIIGEILAPIWYDPTDVFDRKGAAAQLDLNALQM